MKNPLKNLAACTLQSKLVFCIWTTLIAAMLSAILPALAAAEPADLFATVLTMGENLLLFLLPVAIGSVLINGMLELAKSALESRRDTRIVAALFSIGMLHALMLYLLFKLSTSNENGAFLNYEMVMFGRIIMGCLAANLAYADYCLFYNVRKTRRYNSSLHRGSYA